MKLLNVELRNGLSEIIRVRENDTPEAWQKDAGKRVVLNGISYPKDDIVRVSEHKARKGSTNMEGI